MNCASILSLFANSVYSFFRQSFNCFDGTGGKILVACSKSQVLRHLEVIGNVSRFFLVILKTG